MKVLIRTDASVKTGSGHVMRCLTLAEKLRANSVEIIFVCRELEGHLGEHIRQSGFELILLPWAESDTKAIDPSDLYATWLAVPMPREIDQTTQVIKATPSVDWLIVDHYALDHKWEAAMRPLVGSIMVIDDLTNRKHDCDTLLNQNLMPNPETEYHGLVSNKTKLLLGPEYALLRDEFALARKTGSDNRTSGHWLICYGGIDPTNETSKAIKAIDLLGELVTGCDVVVGRANPFAEQVKLECDQRSQLNFHQGVTNIAQLMARAGLALGAPGSSTWERCAVGLPSLLTSIADNQLSIGDSIARGGYGLFLGESTQVTPAMIAEQGADLMRQPKLRRAMRETGMKLVDGLGAARVCEQLILAANNRLAQPECRS